MSMSKIFREHTEAIMLLRRILKVEGHAKALRDAENFLKVLDANEEAYKKRQAEEQAKATKRLDAKKRSRLHSGRFEIAPVHENGCDHSSPGIVLLRGKDGARLVWRSGGSYWSGRSQNYAPAELEVLMPGQTMPKKITSHFFEEDTKRKIKRLSKDLVLSYQEQIDSMFGAGAAKLAAELDKTVILKK